MLKDEIEKNTNKKTIGQLAKLAIRVIKLK